MTLKDSSRLRIWTVPVVSLIFFVLFSAFSLYTINKDYEKEYIEDAMSNLRVLEVAFVDIILHGESFAEVQKRIDRLISRDSRIVRLSFITRDADGVLRHVASSLPARVGKKANPEDLEALTGGRIVILEEKNDGNDCIDITYPVRGDDGRTLGIIGYTVVDAETSFAPWLLTFAALVVVGLLIFHFRWVQMSFESEIGHRKRVEERLREAMVEAENASRLKSSFLANVSHEIRTPLNGIMGMAQLLLRSDLAGDQTRQAQMILSSGERLLVVINDILDFSKIEAGMMELVPTDFDLRRTLDEVMHPLGLRAREKGLELKWETAPGIPRYLHGDSGRLAQILNNLVGNAIKYSDHGTVQVTVTPGSDEDGSPVLFKIKDSGRGIRIEDREVIFEAFMQARDAKDGESFGTGLGLSVSKKIAALMGGNLWLAESGESGSTFCFTAALTPATAAAGETGVSGAEQPDPAVINDCHVLLAEDEYINRAIVKALFEEKGWRLTTVENGGEAVDAFEKERFDLILMDVTMPVMDGFAATARIRELERGTGSRVPIVAMTAHAVSGYREKCLAAGMDDYLTKPFDDEGLCRVISRNLRRG